MKEMEEKNSSSPENIGPTPSPAPGAKTNKLILIGLGFLLLLSLASTCLLFCQNNQLKKQIAQLQATPTPIAPSLPTSAPTQSLISDATANWKTYTNEKYKYTFKYPEEYSQGEVESYHQTEDQMVRLLSSNQSERFRLIVIDNPKRYDIKKYYENLEKTSDSADPVSPFSQKEPIIKTLFNGDPVYFFKDIYCVTVCNEAFWQNEDRIYELVSYPQYENIEKPDTLLELILSTFRFLD